MNRKQILTIISIVAFSGVTSLVYGVTNGTIIVGDLTVTGTCTGCSSGGEGSFTSYTTLFNGTITGSVGCPGSSIYVNNTGTVLVTDNCPTTFIVQPSGTATKINTPIGSAPFPISSAQSITGLYQIAYDANTIKVYKNNSLIQSIGFDTGNFGAPVGGGLSINISPNGKYIAIQNEDVSTSSDRLVIFKGS